MLNGPQQIDAIVWASKREHLSYGEFSLNATDEQLKKVFSEYEEELTIRKSEEKERLKKAVTARKKKR